MQSAKFAIGDISGNWLNDRKKAQRVGVVFTRPILTSSLSVLISRNLLQELGQNKSNDCLQRLSRQEASVHRWNGSKVNAAETLRCSDPVTIEDIFNFPQLNRLVIKGSAVHEYFITQQSNHLSDLILVEKSSLFGYGLEKLQKHQYVLVDENKFTEYFADQNCHFDLIQASSRFNGEMANVQIDETPSAPSPSWKLSPLRFVNEITIAMSSSLPDSANRRDWLREFNRAIERLERSGKLRQLQDKHWRNTCRKSQAINQAGVALGPFLSLLTCCLLLTFPMLT